MSEQPNNSYNNPFFKGTIDRNGNTLNLNPDLYGNLFTLSGEFALRYIIGDKKSIGANVLIPSGVGIGGFPINNGSNYYPATLELAAELQRSIKDPSLIKDSNYQNILNSAYKDSFLRISRFEIPAIHQAKKSKNALLRFTDYILGNQEVVQPTRILRPMFLTENQQFKPNFDYSKFRFIPIIKKEV